MNKVLALSIAALIASLPLVSFAAESTCDAVKADISAKIINNGVPESGFELTIVPEDQAEQSQGKVVGSCDNGTQRVIYVRHINVDSAGTGGSKAEYTEHMPAQ